MHSMQYLYFVFTDNISCSIHPFPLLVAVQSITQSFHTFCTLWVMLIARQISYSNPIFSIPPLLQITSSINFPGVIMIRSEQSTLQQALISEITADLKRFSNGTSTCIATLLSRTTQLQKPFLL